MDDIRAIIVGILNLSIIKSLFKDFDEDPELDLWNEITSFNIVMVKEPIVFVWDKPRQEVTFLTMTQFNEEYVGEDLKSHEFQPVKRK